MVILMDIDIKVCSIFESDKLTHIKNKYSDMVAKIYLRLKQNLNLETRV